MGGGGADGVSARVGAGSSCINLSEERHKQSEWLIGLSDGSQEEIAFFSKLINTSGLRFLIHAYIKNTQSVKSPFSGSD